MKIDLKTGNIYAPGYELNGVNGNATFEGTVKANSGHFDNGVTLGTDKMEVKTMLSNLNTAVNNANSAIT
jgi:hypothetical protein